MGEARVTPGVYGVSPGVDFAETLVRGLRHRFSDSPPEALARTTVIVNTTRMRRRIKTLLAEDGPILMPRLRLITDIGSEDAPPDLPPPQPPLRRRLEIARLVGALLDSPGETAPRSALFPLTESLIRLIDEMQSEGVGPAILDALDLANQSEHWQRRRTFLSIVFDFLDRSGPRPPDPALRQTIAVERLIERWGEAPPEHPVILAGSTGSRNTTRRLMQAITTLPQGAIVLPGFACGMPDAAWQALDGEGAEDHPQYRYKILLDVLGVHRGDVSDWAEAPPPSTARNALVSLALRPAPVTHQWLSEGPALAATIPEATRDVSLIEAPGPRLEAMAIALCLRHAVEHYRPAALITPDRMLTRRVTAILDRWGIHPDDSGGEPLGLSAPGRFLRHLAGLMGEVVEIEPFLVLLKHPLAHSADDRGVHLLHTRDLELFLRKRGAPHPSPEVLADWTKDNDARAAWLAQVRAALDPLAPADDADLQLLTRRLMTAAEALARGSSAEGAGKLWDGDDGEAARAAMAELELEANSAGRMSIVDFRGLVAGLLSRDTVRKAVAHHPGVLILGTLEARVQTAPLTILGGLNEGVWPGLPDPDPWLSRPMRKDAGLLLPERQIGLSAHDFQQAIAAPEVILSRSLRDAEADTVPSRWLNRLTNLMKGIDGPGAQALDAMRARGAHWLAMAQALDTPTQRTDPAPRPSPRPPVAARPKSLSVTSIRKLIQDPYAIYAAEVLRLRPVDPIRPAPDARLRGTIVHDIVERFLKDGLPDDDAAAIAKLVTIAEGRFGADALWPVAARLWLSSIERIAPEFVADERKRLAEASPVGLEVRGVYQMDAPSFELRSIADRIDQRADGRLVIYDYKTGTKPRPQQVEDFDKQLLLEALMAEAGGFGAVGKATVDHVAHIGLGSDSGMSRLDLVDTEKHNFALATVLDHLRELIRAYEDPETGYTSRRAMARASYPGDYDHLARFGEWDDATPASPEDVE